MPVKIQKKKKDLAQSQSKTSKKVKDIDQIDDTHDHLETSPQTDTQSHSAQQQGNVDLWNFLAQMTQMMWQQNEMMKMMDERMKKLEEQNAPKVVEGEVVKEPEVVVPLNENNVASYSREDEEGYAEVVNKVWKIMYVLDKAPVMMWDSSPMMTTVEERRRVWNMTVSDTKYFNSESEAKAYIENLRQKGIILPDARIIPCYI